MELPLVHHSPYCQTEHLALWYTTGISAGCTELIWRARPSGPLTALCSGTAGTMREPRRALPQADPVSERPVCLSGLYLGRYAPASPVPASTQIVTLPV